MSVWTRGLALAGIIAIAVAMASPASAQIKLKWAHVYEVTEPFHTEALWAASEIKKRPNGKFDIEVFPASRLGNENQLGPLRAKITDPFGRFATLAYDGTGRLSSITDVLGIQSSFTYSATDPGFIRPTMSSRRRRERKRTRSSAPRALPRVTSASPSSSWAVSGRAWAASSLNAGIARVSPTWRLVAR